jgi:MFS transporter, MHS family, shikimate and dehydroshikimate transport protein
MSVKNIDHKRPSKSQMRKIVAASVAGNALEWYDFFLYGTAAALVFSKLFFPTGTDPLTGTLAAFAGFAVGFAARPFGGIVFGHIGDRLGRKYALVLTLCIMGAATFCIGLLPTYDKIGIWAPALLVLLRLLQGIAAGGEWGGGVLIISENAPPEQRGRGFCPFRGCVLFRATASPRGVPQLGLARSISGQHHHIRSWNLYSFQSTG